MSDHMEGPAGCVLRQGVTCGESDSSSSDLLTSLGDHPAHSNLRSRVLKLWLAAQRRLTSPSSHITRIRMVTTARAQIQMMQMCQPKKKDKRYAK